MLGRSTLAAATGVAAGVVAWTATEYSTHRWLLHGPFGHGRLSRVPIGGIHRTHHAQPERTVPLARLAGNLAVAGAGMFGAHVLSAVIPAAGAWAAGLTFSAGYSTYDIVHHRLHHRPPTTPLGRRMRQRHFRHHFGAPRGNLGVTMSWWDRVAGTEVARRQVKVPAKFAPEWLEQLGPDFVAA